MQEQPMNITKDELFSVLVEPKMEHLGLKREDFEINFKEYPDKEQTTQIEIEFINGIFNVFYQMKAQQPYTLMTDFKTIRNEWDSFVPLSVVKDFFIEWLEERVENKIKEDNLMRELHAKNKIYRERYEKTEKIKTNIKTGINNFLGYLFVITVIILMFYLYFLMSKDSSQADHIYFKP
jgi:hypothetical protein